MLDQSKTAEMRFVDRRVGAELLASTRGEEAVEMEVLLDEMSYKKHIGLKIEWEI